MGKTIKQIADEIGVSKQAVSYRLKQIQTAKKDTLLATKENGVLVVSLAAEKLIKQAFLENDRQKEPPKDRQKEPPKEDGFLAVLQITTDALQTQLAVKDEQLREKDEQVRNLQSQIAQLTAALENTTAALTAAQALHAADKKQLLIEQEAEASTPTPRHWWQRKKKIF